MEMYEELVKRLREWPRVCVQYDGSVDQLHDDAADAIEELIRMAEVNAKRALKWASDAEKAKASPWISIKEIDKLPDDGVKVICISKNGRVSDCDCLKSYVTKIGNYDMTTHWMPFQQPPKEDA